MDDATTSPGPNTCAALVEAQAAINAVEKGSTNAFHKYKYASGDDIIAEGRAALNGAGLATFATRWQITETPYQWTDEKGAVIDDVALRLLVRYRLVHASGEVMDFEPFSVPVLPEKGRPIDKAEAGARTYALSYFLRDLLLIPRVDEGSDVDSRDDSRHDPRNRAKQSPPPARSYEAQRSHVQAVAPAAESRPASPSPWTAAQSAVKRYPSIKAEAEALLLWDADDAAKLAELKRLCGMAARAEREAAAPPASAAPAPREPAFAALDAEARKLLLASEHDDPAPRAKAAELLQRWSQGRGTVDGIDSADLGGFVSEVSAVLNGPAVDEQPY